MACLRLGNHRLPDGNGADHCRAGGKGWAWKRFSSSLSSGNNAEDEHVQLAGTIQLLLQHTSGGTAYNLLVASKSR